MSRRSLRNRSHIYFIFKTQLKILFSLSTNLSQRNNILELNRRVLPIVKLPRICPSTAASDHSACNQGLWAARDGGSVAKGRSLGAACVGQDCGASVTFSLLASSQEEGGALVSWHKGESLRARLTVSPGVRAVVPADATVRIAHVLPRESLVCPAELRMRRDCTLLVLTTIGYIFCRDGFADGWIDSPEQADAPCSQPPTR